MNKEIQDDGAYNSKEFDSFSRSFKQFLTVQFAGYGLELAGYSKGHYYISGFVQNRETKKFAYFSISDVRGNPNTWQKAVLVRTAKDTKDFTGGSNNFVAYDVVAKVAKELTS